jgi:hypothetical protein
MGLLLDAGYWTSTGQAQYDGSNDHSIYRFQILD